MKISESTEFKIDIKTVIGIIMLTTTLVGMYYTLEKDIQLAKTLPPNEVTRLEYELKEECRDPLRSAALPPPCHRLPQNRDIIQGSLRLI